MNCPACGNENDSASHACVRCGTQIPQPTVVSEPPVGAVLVSVDLSPGTVFARRYEIVRQLGQGGMGMVYLARDRTLDEAMAIKVLRPDFARDPAMAARFRSEIKLARRVRHKNVAAIHDYGEDEGLLFISMEFVDGVDLKQLLRKRGAFPAAEAYELAIQVTEGLQAVHDAGVIHRDLKTPNIMVDAKNVARLMDFGIAKQHGVDGGATTGTGNIVGTPEYMSPEQAQGKKVDFRCDIYAMGIVIYEMFTGKVPFRGETPIATILKHIQEPPTLEGPEAPPLPPSLVPVLKRCLAKDPEHRYASASELSEGLRRARSPSRKQEPLPTAVLQAPTLRQPSAVPSRARATVAAGAAGVVVLAGGIFLWSRRAPEPTHVESTPTASPSPSPSAVVSTEPPTPERTLPPVLVAETTPVATGPAASKAIAAAATRRPTDRPTALAAAPVAPMPPPASAAPTIPATAAATAAPDAPSADPGWLLVAALPWANVYVDGVEKGTTPRDKFPLSAGRHQVVIEYPGYERHEETVLIRAGQTETLKFNFLKQGTAKK
jgi:serine/threonine protein kinase